MCELFAMSSRHPATVSLSLAEFSRHGGQTAGHKDGWGIVWYEDGDARQIKEAQPAADSACVRFVQQHPLRSAVVLSHIRKATQGAVATRNCQPFIRELGGVWHSFAHNGHLVGLGANPGMAALHHRPVGETDSELAFCALLGRLAPLWLGPEQPSLAARRAVVEAFAAELRTHGPANFLYSDGELLFAHAHRRTQADGTVSPPGLWRLARHCETGGELHAAGLGIVAHGDGQSAVQEVVQDVVLVASVPLTGEAWVPLPEGTLIVARLGALGAECGG